MLKMIPVTGLDADFQFEQVNAVLDIINEAGGTTNSLVVDGNRVNQAFYKMFETVPGKPWLTVDGKFLLFDFVHLLKSIRNNCLTEETGNELQFKDKEKIFVAKWADLLQLYHLEKIEGSKNTSVHGLSKLTEAAIKPKPVERQRVTTYLRVFCEETMTALKVHLSLTASEGTSLFMKKVVDMWKILNVHTITKDIRHNDPLEAVVKSQDDPRLSYLLEMGETFKNMGRKEGKPLFYKF